VSLRHGTQHPEEISQLDTIGDFVPVHTLWPKPLVVHVAGRVDTLLGEFRDLSREALLNGLQHSLIVLVADKGDTQTLGSETTCTTNTMKVGVRLVGHIVVDRYVDTLDIDTSTEDISGDTDTRLELLELLVTLDTN
jgi:hypothetical protein